MKMKTRWLCNASWTEYEYFGFYGIEVSHRMVSKLPEWLPQTTPKFWVVHKWEDIKRKDIK